MNCTTPLPHIRIECCVALKNAVCNNWRTYSAKRATIT
jgi:hypothetical protein